MVDAIVLVLTVVETTIVEERVVDMVVLLEEEGPALLDEQEPGRHCEYHGLLKMQQ